MKRRAIKWALRLVLGSGLWLSACAGKTQPATAQDRQVTSGISRGDLPLPPEPTAADKPAGADRWEDLLATGRKLLDNNQPDAAIREGFDPIIAHFEDLYKSEKRRVYCARTPMEGAFYQYLAKEKAYPVLIIESTWAMAYHFKGYALVEKRDLGSAEVALRKGLQHAPANTLILSELGHIQQENKAWSNALEIFDLATQTSEVSPPESSASERSRALRGAGFSLIELNRLDEATTRFKECLTIDPNDQRAKEELRYIQELREKGGNGS